MRSMSIQDPVIKTIAPAPGVIKEETCFGCFEVQRGLKLLVVLQIITCIVFFMHLAAKTAGAINISDGKMEKFLAVQFVSNLPRIYACYLAWCWDQVDDVRTRVLLKRSMLIWFLVDCIALFNKTIMNQWIMGRSFAGYSYIKQWELPLGHPDGLQLTENEAMKPDLHQMLNYIWKKEKALVWARAIFWAPFKLYFYFIACKYANTMNLETVAI